MSREVWCQRYKVTSNNENEVWFDSDVRRTFTTNDGFREKGPRCGKRYVRRKLCEFFMAGFCPDDPECKNGVHLKSLTGRKGELEDEKQRKGRVADLERREEEQRKEFGWKGRRGRGGGGSGRWRDKKDRDKR